ncbi:hypothetical protein FGO68_gene13838 [Halteria grandinella]|uniref:Roadblock/LAMTOR2 domain-containing protein n=1 Tax=Halteria grandinella TaxID=5974 RepID=A0A8J8NG47_HALGN|nr:hypothetical protein FGO68_gene13838 [Halteria grandinella]
MLEICQVYNKLNSNLLNGNPQPTQPSFQSQKVEETINRINTHKGVKGIIVVNSRGIAIRSTMSQNDTIEYGSLITQFTAKAQSTIKALHPDDDVQFIRIRSKKHEIMIAPEKDYSLIVLQNPSNNDDAQH